jgi:hypothetical protein
LDANIGATRYLVDHLRDPSSTVPYCQSIEAPVSIPFVHTVRAAELRWWHGYLIAYHSFNDLILLRGHYRNSLNYHISTITWHMGKSAQDIYTTALIILQVGQPTIQLPPILTLTVSVWKKRIGYIKTSKVKSTTLFHKENPLLTKHYRGETLVQLWNQV